MISDPTSQNSDLFEDGSVQWHKFLKNRPHDLVTNNNSTSNNTGGVFRNQRGSGIYKCSRIKRRLVAKNGSCIIVSKNVRKRSLGYLSDIFTTLVDMPWQLNILIFIFSFFLTWIFYACIWWIITLSHGDVANHNNSTRLPCVTNIYSFTSAFLFSVESQLTIGYGHRYLTEECPDAIIILCLQSITGIIMQSFMVGVVFAKLTQPRRRAGTLMFSKKAVICQRDGIYCLIFRVGDMRKSHLIGATVRAHLLKQRVTHEGEVIPLYMNDVNLGFNTGKDRLFLLIPFSICHEIDEKSPFWNMSAEDLKNGKFELIVILEGTIESTGCTLQARTSYLPSEIFWGYCLQRLITYEKEDIDYHADFRYFDEVYVTNMPRCSAKEFSESAESNAMEASNYSVGGSFSTQTFVT